MQSVSLTHTHHLLQRFLTRPGINIFSTVYGYWRRFTQIWSYIPGPRTIVYVLFAGLLLNFVLAKGWIRVPLLESAGVYQNLDTAKLAPPYEELNKFVQLFHRDEAQITRMYDLQLRLKHTRAAVNVMKFESKEKMSRLTKSCLNTTYHIER